MNLVVAHLERIESKVDKLDDRLDTSEKVQVKQEANLAEHMRRTALLEEGLKPVQKHVTRVEGGLKLLGLISVVVEIIVGVAKLLGA